jgi:uncharacterized protein YeaO (DUF488 family)
MIKLKRVYDEAKNSDGARYLVDRLWPRGLKKERLQAKGWLKTVAPSDSLRRWFQHDPAKWSEFCRRYLAELEGKPETWSPLLPEARAGDITLLFSAHDIEHNNAAALRDFLEARLKAGAKQARTTSSTASGGRA